MVEDRIIAKTFAVGKPVEQEVKRFLETFFFGYFGRIEVSNGWVDEGDLYSVKRRLFIEVKFDTMVERTGQYFVERGAFERSRSFYWFFVNSTHYSIVRRESLEEIMENVNLETRKGGDFKRFEGVLVPAAVIHFHAKSYPRNWQKDPQWYHTYVLKRGGFHG